MLCVPWHSMAWHVCGFSCISSFRLFSHATIHDVTCILYLFQQNARLFRALISFVLCATLETLFALCLLSFVYVWYSLFFYFILNSILVHILCVCNIFPDSFLTSVILILLFTFDAIYVSNTIFI